MKAEIKKGIGNTFIITVDNHFFDIVFWKKASDLFDNNPGLNLLLGMMLPSEIEMKDVVISEKKALKLKEKLEYYTSKGVHWIDKYRPISEIIEMGIDESIVYIQTHDFKIKESQFVERENPKITYVFKTKGFELIVNKTVFMHYKTEPTFKAKRAI